MQKKYKNHTVCIPVEVFDREINYKLILALKLAKDNFEVCLGIKSDINKFIIKNPNKYFFYFDKGLTITRKDYYHYLNNLGVKIIVLDEEILNISPSIREDILDSKFDTRLLSYIDHVLLPKKELFEYFSHKSKYQRYLNKFCISGHPKFDIYTKNNFKILKKFSNEISLNKYILIICSFVYFNNVSKDYDLNLWNYYFSQKKDLFKNYSEVEKYQKILFRKFEILIKKISETYPNKTIVVRPHPSENLKIYNEKFNNYLNIKIISKFPVEEWLLKADVVIHHDSSSVIDMQYLNKKPIAYLPFGRKKFLQQYAIQSSIEIDNYNKVINLISEKNDDFNKININNVTNATSIIIKKLNKMDKVIKKNYFIFNYKIIRLIKFYSLISNIHSFSKKLFFKSSALRVRQKYTDGIFDTESIQKKIDIISSENVTVTKINSNCIKISQ